MARPLSHPGIDDVSVASVLHALADPMRLAIVRELLKVQGGMNCTQTTCKLKIPMAKSTCSQHYRILREAGIIASERKGVELSSRVRMQELDERFPGLLQTILKAHEKEQVRANRRARA
jgi:DNA-binding transcriptional ArsR family regulator